MKIRQKREAHVVVVYDPNGIVTDKKITTPSMLGWWCREVHRRARAWNGIVGNFTILEFFGERLKSVYVFPVENDSLMNVGTQYE